jgi:DNA replication and repair protein RecF
VGNNGVGKTNMLDAIHYLSMTKSFFNPIDSQNINHGKDFFVIQGTFITSHTKNEIYCGLKKNKKKQFKKNGKEYDRFSEHVGSFPVVMISPNDIFLITGGSDERRRFIDTVIAQYDMKYLDNLIRYNRALAQRNKLLKDTAGGKNFDKSLFSVLDDQLHLHGTQIYHSRLAFAEKLLPVFQRYYKFISLNNEKVKLKYESDLKEGELSDLLKSTFERDRVLLHTTKGVHRDDLTLNIHDHPIKKVGSQGQQKTFLVALKLAKFEFIAGIKGGKPILLLDDIFDKFDKKRVTQIIELVGNQNFGQIFITDTKEERLKSILAEMAPGFKLFEVIDGNIKNLENEKK